MKKATIANLNIEFMGINNDFWNERMKEYENNAFTQSDMKLKVTACDEITVPNGELIEKFNKMSIAAVKDNKICRCLTDDRTGEIINAIYYNKDYSEVEIQLLKGRVHPVFSLTDLEYLYTAFSFRDRITYLGGSVIHASAIAYENQGIIFSADSGTGKSTHTGLWKERFGDKLTIVNDDKPALRFYDDEPYIFGTPWSGKTDINSNIKMPLKAIVFIRRSEKNRIQRLNVRDSIFNLTRQIWRPSYDETIGEKTLDVIDRLIQSVPVYMLHCNISQEAVDTVYDEIINCS